jgi:serine/threonine protein kinase HipA of HipAB toxin-antitoxin module
LAVARRFATSARALVSKFCSDRVEQTVNKAVARLTMLRWALFQFLIGNTDAHGKNFSFFVRRQGLEPAPWYDLVSVLQYPGIHHEIAMAYGDAFSLDEVGAFQLADFAKRCKVDRRLLKRVHALGQARNPARTGASACGRLRG